MNQITKVFPSHCWFRFDEIDIIIILHVLDKISSDCIIVLNGIVTTLIELQINIAVISERNPLSNRPNPPLNMHVHLLRQRSDRPVNLGLTGNHIANRASSKVT